VDNDGYASSPLVIAVAACNDTSRRSVYSDFGKAVWCCFPSSDFGDADLQQPNPLTPGIWTTDRTGSAGYNPGNLARGDIDGNYTNSFGGTSSSCPGAAGVAALVISANPSLSATEVRDILRRACIKIDPQNGEYDTNGHSPYYGFGRLDAAAAVKLAKAKVGRLSIFRKLVNVPIPDLGKVQEVLDVGETAAVDGIIASVRLEHTYIGDLVITLIPPSDSGLAKVILHNRDGGRTKNLDRQYSSATTPALAAYIGKSCKGVWTIQVEDKAAQDAGMLLQIELQLSVPPLNPPTEAPQVREAAERKVHSVTSRNGSPKKKPSPKKKTATRVKSKK
jgi:subtilisin-like proprotein convertase family protein